MRNELTIHDTNDQERTNDRDITLNAESQRALAEIKASIAIAMQRPRSEALAQAHLERTLERKSFCEKAVYVFPRGKEEVKGPSVNLAREFERCWGNMISGHKIVHDSDESRTVECFAWDLETNVKKVEQITFKKVWEYKDPKLNRIIARPVNERELRELTAKHGAFGERNCILRLAPRDIIDDAVDKALEIIAKNIEKEDIKKVRTKIINSFSEISVLKEEIEDYLGHSIDQTTSKEIAALRGIYKSINDGVSKKEEYFKKPKQDTSAPKTKDNIDMSDLLGNTVV